MSSAAQIEGFLKDLGHRHRLQVLLQALARWGLLLGVAVLVLDWLVSGLLPWTVGAALLWVILVVLVAVRRRRLALRQLDRRLELRDRLATWKTLRRDALDAPMALWLSRELAERLASIPEPDRRELVARPVGGLRYLLPALILLLLLKLFAPLGASGGGGGGVSFAGGGAGGSDGGGGAGGESGPGTSAPGPQPPREGPGAAPPPAGEPDTEPPAEGPPPPPEPARPLAMDLEVRDEFAVPHFVGEGPTRLQTARQARVPEGPPPPPVQSASGAGQPPPPDVPDFERAYERALQARHVREDERGFLRRYFTLLREAGR